MTETIYQLILAFLGGLLLSGIVALALPRHRLREETIGAIKRKWW